MIRRRGRRNRRVTGVWERLRRGGNRIGAWCAQTVPTVLLFATMVAAPLAGYTTWIYMKRSSFFALQHVSIEGNKLLSGRRIEEIVREQGSSNLLQLDLDTIEAALRATGWVRSIHLDRVLPDTLRIRLHEYKPVATLLAGGERLLDAGGKPFRMLHPDEPVPRPVITGLANPDDPAVLRLVRRALLITFIYRQSGLPEHFDTLAQIHHDPARGFSLVTEKHRAVVFLGHTGFKESIARLRFVVGDFRRRGLGVPLQIHADLGPERVVAARQPRPDHAAGNKVSRIEAARPKRGRRPQAAAAGAVTF